MGQKTSRRLGIIAIASVLLVFGLIIAAVLLLPRSNDRLMEIDGSSMEPTILAGDIVRVDSDAYDRAEPQRGDLVLYDFTQSGDLFVKRLIGLPGDTITIENDAVHIDGEMLQEPYLADGMITIPATGRWVVADGEYFVMGDNRTDSADSRSFGAIPRDWIIGKVISITNPPEHRREFPWIALSCPGRVRILIAAAGDSDGRATCRTDHIQVTIRREDDLCAIGRPANALHPANTGNRRRSIVPQIEHEHIAP
jgi:signal peptidase I